MQIIRTIPRLLITLHLSHMGFTLVLTFIINPLEKVNYFTPFPKSLLQVARPDLSFLYQTLMVMHLELRLNLAHGVKIDANQDQERGSAHQHGD